MRCGVAPLADPMNVAIMVNFWCQECWVVVVSE
jgi:hypothetical protein